MKFKLDHKKVHPKLLTCKRERNYLIIECPTIHGRVRLEIEDGDIVESNDPLLCAALDGYRHPKIPLRRGDAPLIYDYRDWKDKKVFTKTKAKKKAQHVI